MPCGVSGERVKAEEKTDPSLRSGIGQPRRTWKADGLSVTAGGKYRRSPRLSESRGKLPKSQERQEPQWILPRRKRLVAGLPPKSRRACFLWL